jgi:hypothetical protein
LYNISTSSSSYSNVGLYICAKKNTYWFCVYFKSNDLVTTHNLRNNTSHYGFMHHYCCTSFSPLFPRIIYCTVLCNHHFLFHLVPFTALHWHLEQTLH